MKNLKSKFRYYIENIDKRWKLLSLEKQHQYLLTFLLGYGLINGCVFIKIGYDLVQSNQKLHIEHIVHPMQKRIEKRPLVDTITTIHKNDSYERNK